MFDILFPRIIDNRLRGRALGFWLLVPVLILKLGIAGASLLTPGQANRADGIDGSSYSVAAIRHAEASTALLGLLHLSIGLLCVLAMIRYRAMTPLIYLWLILEFLGRRLVLGIYPIDRTPGTPSGSFVNIALISMLVFGFALSLWPRRNASREWTEVTVR